MKYEIHTRFINEWENVWHCDGQLMQFDTYEQAYTSLNDYLDEETEEFDIEDFKIVEVTQ